MGQLVDGKWERGNVAPTSGSGRFQRQSSQFRSWVTPDGSPGPSGSGGFAAERDRYHLYVSLACPWAHRALVMRALKQLEPIISVSVVHWLMGEDGWTFAEGPGATGDAIHGASFLHQVYTAAVTDYSGKVTVPVLWDKQRSTIVNNESAEILRMFGSAFDAAGAAPGDYYPEDLAEEIDSLNERIYRAVNNGVYRAGFATSQEAYEEAVHPLFECLDWLERRLTDRRYLCGDRLTEADIRLFTTLIRFDAAYYGHFKCNLRRLVDYPALWRLTQEIARLPGVAQTIDFDHIKKHYYQSHRAINPTGIVPAGPVLEF